MRSWPSGHVAQLKLAVSRLEEQLNSSLSQSTLQTASRKVSDQIPFVLPTEFTVRTGYRQAQVFWEAPPGLNGHPYRQLLFYELQHASTSSFYDATTLTTPQRNVIIAGLGLGTLRSFRVRIVNTFGIAGPWSIIQTVRLARNRIEITSLAGTTGTTGINKRLTKPIGVWQTVLEDTYSPLGGAISLTTQAALACPRHDLNLKVGGSTVETYYGGPGFVQLRYLIGAPNDVGDIIFKELGSSRFILSARPGFLKENDLDALTPTALGSIPSVFYRPENSSDTLTIRLQAAKMAGSEWKGRRRERALLASTPLLSLRNSLAIEVLES